MMKKQRRTYRGKIRASLIEGDEAKKRISEADRLRAIAFLLGEIFGILLGVPTSIRLGLLTGFVEIPRGDSLGALVEGFSFLSFTILFGCSIAFVSSIYLWKRRGKINFGNCVLSSLTVLFLWTYVILIMAFIFEPLDAFLLKYYSPVSVFWKGALVFFPFMLLAAYISFPSLRPVMQHNLRIIFTRQFWKKAWRKPKSRWKIAIFSIFFAILIVEFVWKILQN
jgi:hypothetical protein